MKPGMTANLSFIIAQRESVLNVPNSVLRFHPPEGFMPTNAAVAVTTNLAAADTDSASHTGGHAGHHGKKDDGKPHGQRPLSYTVYVLTGTGEAARMEPVQITTGISDGISTEVLSGLKEGDQVVVSMTLPGQKAAPNPFGNGPPRMR